MAIQKILSNLQRNILNKLKNYFLLDLRSLAIFRIAFGVGLWIDFLDRINHLSSHYTDLGILPRKALFELLWQYSIWSFHTISGSIFFQIILFLFHGILILFFILGFNTKISTILLWIFTVSIQNRSLMMLYGADDIMRLFLFWGMFLPLGDRFSIDSIIATDRRNSNSYISIGTVATVLQICIIYIFTAMLKNGDPWKNGTAVYLALSNDQFATPFGKALLQFPKINYLLTFFTISLEKYGPILLFFPFYTVHIRMFLVTIFVVLHFGFLLFLSIGVFPWVCISYWLLLIPTSYIERIILFLKNKISNIEFLFFHTKFTEIIEQKIKTKAILLQIKPNVFNTNFFRISKDVFCIFSFILVFLYNIQTLNFGFKMTEALRDFCNALRLNQKWDLFAPYPVLDDGWYILEAKLNNQEAIDLNQNGKPVVWDKPQVIRFSGPHEHKYLARMWLKKNYKIRYYYAQHICNQWNAIHSGDEQAKELAIYYMLERTLPNYQHSIPQKKLLWKQDCIQQKVIF